ncbi:Structural maintenance of chromosomes protein 1B [Microtus ochrogaster]|uniref:Structural maintenance of chromosomes protein 1B n=1 Tax=Microtus ochrogaster TaxID=79684 RepID=A0A8J6KX27_MICOH|nr:Structural maintenance of chromosomes protein 1B [Microtus ochrogaster]
MAHEEAAEARRTAMGHLELLLVENFKSWRGLQVIGPFKRFTCIIGPNGSGGCSEFHFGDKPVTRSAYVAQLEKIGIIVKAQNCLVFQGTVESISMKKPKERTQFFEEISTSGEFIGEYEAKKKMLQKAEEDAQFHFNRKKNVAAERKHAKIEKEEAEHYQSLLEELKINKIQLMLFQLYYNEEKINVLNTELEHMDRNLSVVKDTLSHHENIIKAKKKDHGMLSRQLQQTEKELKTDAKDSKPKRDTITWYQDFEKSQKTRRRLFLRKEASHTGEWSEKGSPARDPIDNIEWKAKLPVKEKVDLLKVEQLDRYKELKEQVRRKVAIMTQQLEKLQWEQKAEKERLAFEKRRHGDTQGNLKQIKEQIEEHKKRIEKLEEYTKTCMDCLKDKKQQEEALIKEIENTKSRMSEVNDELGLITNELQNAGIDNHEGKRQRKRAEVLESLKRLYPDSVIKPINERLREIKGCKMMIDVIKTQFPQLKKVIQFVCGNGLVCETVEEARHIAFSGPERRKELMKTLRKETDLKQIQTLVQGTNTRLKYSQNELEMLKKKHLAAFYREQSQLQSELLNIESQCAMLNEGINNQQQKIEEFQDRIDKVEDEIFQDFCEEIGVENIREFENKHVKQQQENDQKRLEFEKQKTRLSIQLEYSRNQLKKKLNKIDTLKMTIQKGREDIDNLKKTEEEYLKSVDELMIKQEQVKEVLASQSSNIEKIHIQIEEERKKFLAVDREVGKLQKEVIIIQGSLEQKQLEKHNLLLDCKVQDIEISLVLGSLEDIIEVELTETESTQATADIYEKEASIQVDYSPLREDLKALQSDKEVKDHLTLLLEQVASQENTLMKTAAPNLRAQENLKAVRDKFQESADAFEASRKEARVCRQEFEQVKRRRYDAFSQCFEHISVSIDQIYKKLCRNSSAQAFLSPENAEEPYLDGISYNCVAPGKRFMPMDNLSGGEKCVAALALLFAVHSFRPAPFFVLDEVDAALDNTNIGKVSSYIKEQSQEQFQMIIISLKEEFYSRADALIGIYPEHDECMFSHVLTLDLSKYPDTEDQEGSRRHRKPRASQASQSSQSPQSR